MVWSGRKGKIKIRWEYGWWFFRCIKEKGLRIKK
jgi:hypothetical protein